MQLTLDVMGGSWYARTRALILGGKFNVVSYNKQFRQIPLLPPPLLTRRIQDFHQHCLLEKVG